MLAIRGGYENVRLTSSGASRCDGPRESEGAAGVRGHPSPRAQLSPTSIEYVRTRQDSTRGLEDASSLSRIQYSRTQFIPDIGLL